MSIRSLTTLVLASSLYATGCLGARSALSPYVQAEDSGAEGSDGGDEDATAPLRAINETNHFLTWVGTPVVFAGRVTGQATNIYWDKDHRDGDGSMDIIGRAVEEGSDRFVGDLVEGYRIPGRYTNTMYASNARETSPGSAGLVTVLDRYDSGRVNSMGESLDDLFGGAELDRIEAVPYNVWADSVQQNSRYAESLDPTALAALAAYQANLARPFGTKDIAQVHIALGPSHDDGRVIFELANPSIYANMPGVFEALWVGREDAEALLDIMDTL